jgi:hypothetical protein
MFVLQVATIQAEKYNHESSAGGQTNGFSGFGDTDVNSTVGSQWKKHAQTLDNYIRKNISVKVYNTAKMNVDLKVIAI